MSTTVILQITSSQIKIGIAGENEPRSCYAINQDISISSSPSELRMHYNRQLNIAFIQKLGLKPKVLRVVIVEDLLEVKRNRDTLLTCLIYDMQVAEVTMQPDIFLAILATPRSSGLIVSIGERECRALAIYEGRPLLHTLRSKF